MAEEPIGQTRQPSGPAPDRGELSRLFAVLTRPTGFSRGEGEQLIWRLADASRERADRLIELIRGGSLDSLDPGSSLWAAVSALTGTRDPKANDLFLELLEHRSSSIRELAAYALIRRRVTSALDVLLKTLRAARLDSLLAFSIVREFRRTPEMQDFRAIPILRRKLEKIGGKPRKKGFQLEATQLLAILQEKKKSVANVEMLDWSGSTINTALLADGSQSRRLKKLVLNDVRRLNAAALRTIAGWSTLEQLTMEWDFILPRLDLDPLGDLSRLRVLRLRNFVPRDRQFGFLSRLQRLEELRLSGVKYTEGALESIGQCRRLRSLNLGNPISEAWLRALIGLRQLESLSLDQCHLTDGGAAFLARLKRLTSLRIRIGGPDDGALDTLAQLPNLRVLGFLGKGLSLGGLRALASFPTVTHLDIGGAAIDDEGLRILSRCRTLEAINLRSGVLTEAGLATLRRMKSLRQLILPERLGKHDRDAWLRSLPRVRLPRESCRLDLPGSSE